MSWYTYNRHLYMYGDYYENYAAVNQTLKRIKRSYGRNWFRADYMAYWVKEGRCIDLRCGWRCMQPKHNKGERVLRLYPDGRITVSANISMPYERMRFNHYFPFKKKWYLWWQYNGIMLHDQSKCWQDTDNDLVISPRYYMRKVKNGTERIVPRYIRFGADGQLTTPTENWRTFKEHKKLEIKQQNRRAKPRKRGWYWTRRARNLYLDQSKCWARDPENYKLRWDERKQCQMERWQTQQPRDWPCGCRTWRKVYKRKFGKTVKQILDEPNATVRSAWMQIYGLQKFFIDAKAQTIAKQDQYSVLRLQTGVKGNQEGRNMQALKMTCPSTGTIYINTIPANINSVPRALNWIYNVPDYLGTVGQQT